MFTRIDVSSSSMRSSWLVTPATKRERTITYAALLAVAFVLMGIHEAVQGSPIFPVDDAYITLHNAVALVRGVDPNYGAPALVGATSAVHTLLVAAMAEVLSPAWALEAVMWMAITAYLLAVASLAFDAKASLPVALGVVLLGVTVGQTPHLLSNGLETGFALALTTLAIGKAHRDELAGKPSIIVPAIAGVLPFVRPELAALSIALLAVRWYSARERGELTGRAMGRDGAIVLACALPFGAALWLSTGAPLPTTIAAKKYYFADGCLPFWPKLTNIVSSIVDFASAVGVFSIAALGAWGSRVGRAGAMFAGVMFAAYFVERPGALGEYDQRYMYVLLPVLLLGVVTMLARGGRWRTVGWLVMAVAALETTVHFRERWRYHMACREFTRIELGGIADFVTAHTAVEERVLIHDAGYISFATTRRLVDIVGLKTPATIDVHRDVTWRTCGRDRSDAIARIAVESAPSALVALGAWDDTFGIARALREHGWGVDLVRPPPAAYRFYRLTPPRAQSR
jgi:hypothetical protein